MAFGLGNVIELSIEARDNSVRVLDEADKRLAKTGESMDRMSRLSIAAGAAMGTALATIGWEAVRVAERIAMIPDATAEATNRLSEMRATLDVAERDLARVKFAAESNGVAFESAATAVYFMNRALVDNPEAFSMIGLEAGTLRAKGTTAALLDVVDALSRMDAETRAGRGQDIFGRGAREAGPLIAMGRGGLAAAFDVADRSGYTPTERLVGLANAYDEVKDASDAASQGIKNATTEKTLPALIAWQDRLTRIKQVMLDLSKYDLMFVGATPVGWVRNDRYVTTPPTTPIPETTSRGATLPPIPEPILDPYEYSYAAYESSRRERERRAREQEDFARRYEGSAAANWGWLGNTASMKGLGEDDRDLRLTAADEAQQAWMRRDWSWLGGTSSMKGLSDADMNTMTDVEQTATQLTEAQKFAADSAGQAASALVYAASGARDFGDAARQALLAIAAQSAARGVSSLVGSVLKGVAGVGAAIAGPAAGVAGAAAGAIAGSPALGAAQIVVPLEKHISQTDRVSNAYDIQRSVELPQDSRFA